MTMSLNVAKCNSGKVKIDPMLIAGCVSWGQRVTSKAHVTRCGVVTRAWRFSFAGVELCMWVSDLWHLADRCGSLAKVCAIFIDSTHHTRSIIFCCFCKYWWIQADRSGWISAWFSKSLRIQADRCRSICRGAANKVPSPPFPSEVSNLFSVSMRDQVGIFPLIWFSVTVPVGSCLLDCFPLMSLDTSLPWPEVLRAHLKHRFPTPFLGDEFNYCLERDPETKMCCLSQNCTIPQITHTVSLQNPTHFKFPPCTLTEGLD